MESSCVISHYPPPTSPADMSGYPSRSTCACAPNSSNPSFYHHLFDTCFPILRTSSSQRYRISCVEMYFATLIYLLRRYASTSIILPPVYAPPRGFTLIYLPDTALFSVP